MAEPQCHYCDRPAEAECATCGRLYCAEHGEDVCLRCLAPESATPSAIAFRGSIAALILGSAVAAFLVISPPQSKSKADPGRTIATSTPAVVATATPTRQGASATPAKTATSEASPTAAASPTPGGSPTAAPSPTPGGERTYTVQAGDTLSGIATQFNTTVEALEALNPGIRPETLQIGAVLKIPPAQ
ncbi:MAG: LysM peptidoglycan-binding domain-containing protein [Chloroflexi bacterium CFX7]|nr:MAG: LysM peptidoglycan-binding domain-containing protein [bacterium]MCE7929316.1 LysM peptidoglycan-binding domain-containing protein [Chloroflexi bacterium CFX7]MCL4230535.1 LysM peptidoglycan-binding domain-containing protein [Dehalococcoidia bacterium]